MLATAKEPWDGSMLTVARSIPPIPITESPRYVGERKGSVHILCTGPGTYEGHYRPLFQLISLGSKRCSNTYHSNIKKGDHNLGSPNYEGSSSGAWCVLGYATGTPPCTNLGMGIGGCRERPFWFNIPKGFQMPGKLSLSGWVCVKPRNR